MSLTGADCQSAVVMETLDLPEFSEMDQSAYAPQHKAEAQTLIPAEAEGNATEEEVGAVSVAAAALAGALPCPVALSASDCSSLTENGHGAADAGTDAPPDHHRTGPPLSAQPEPAGLGCPETPPPPMEVLETFVTVHGERPPPPARDPSAARRADRVLLSEAVAWMRPAADAAEAASSYTVPEVVTPTGAARRKASGVAPTRRLPRSAGAGAQPAPLPFDCDACQTRFGDRLALAAHQREHGAEPAEPCHRCGRLLAAHLDRARHQRRHRAAGAGTTRATAGAGAATGAIAAAAPTRLLPQRRGRGPTRCGVCGGQFRAGALREHFAPHPRTGYYACRHCGAAFAQQCQLDRHDCDGALAPSPPPPPPPPPPAPLSASPSSVAEESESEREPGAAGDDDFEAEDADDPSAGVSSRLSSDCGSASAAGARSEDGGASDGGGGGGPTARHECSRCGRRFATARNLSRHARLHEDTSQVACEVCERVYSRLDALVRHSVEAHEQVRQFPCPRCRWKFTQKRILEYHLKIHEEGGDRARGRGPGRTPRPHRCRNCKRTFVEAAQLEAHECRADRGAQPAYVCDICGKSIKTKVWLSRHRLLHDAVRPAKCDTCGQGFIDDKALAKHMKNHTDGRRFLCDICGKGFALKVTLQIHARTHTGERPYACESCGKRFSTRTQLFHHAKIHSGEKPYVCPVCQRGFRQSHHLKTHMKVHRPERGAQTPQPAMMLVLDPA